MAFGNFANIAQVQTAYQIRYERKAEVITPQSYQPSNAFTQIFSSLSTHIDIYASEEMRKQAVIFPMLADVYQHHANGLTLWSEEYITVPEDAQLNGYPDFLVTARSPLGLTVMGNPLLIVAEAKEDNFTKGWGQCLAAMVAAQRLNKNDGLTVLGIVTNGQTWQFGRLQADLFEHHDTSVDRAKAFGYLQTIFTIAESQIGN
ncbi:hypothetical protein QUF58_11435 [Anaerolineales bacterium HSG24]|nr:hypothetical protein [Anaerolineales bacterium HSG24]